MTEINFASLGLRPEILENLTGLSYIHMTPVQAETLPLILAGKDVIAQAKTGSGKTAAFGLGILQSLDVKRFRIQSLVLCPTRELADQVAQELRKLARAVHNIKVITLCGGTPFGPQLGSLSHGAHIVVGTPGRIEEHLIKGSLQLSSLKLFVLDEADRMLDMGFQPALGSIMGYLPQQRQNLLFSATYPEAVCDIAKQWMQTPVHVKVESTHNRESITQHFYRVEHSPASRVQAVVQLLLKHRPDSAIVFCNTKHEVQHVADTLAAKGLSARALHGDLEQKQRDQTLVQFSNRSISILVATDVAARGLDIEGVDLVVNYQLAREIEVHVHRIGRTARAGNVGRADTLISEKEAFKLEKLSDLLDESFTIEDLPANGTSQISYKAPMRTIQIDGGKKQKLRPGDIVGVLTKAGGIAGDAIGKITVTDTAAYVAVKRADASDALSAICNGQLKGRSFRARLLN